MNKNPTAANRLGIDYRKDAERFAKWSPAIIDVHSHINGIESARIYREVRDLYGINLTYSMSRIELIPDLKEIFGTTMRFIAVPNYQGEDRLYHHGRGFLENIERFYDLGARIVKFWSAPRSKDYAIEAGDPTLLELDSPWRIKVADSAEQLGMMFMVHVADPDTWFKTKYTDTARYGSKIDQYVPLERLLDRYAGPWIAAHMAGWPEDLRFLDSMLSRHDNLYLDTSATKWMVRELSKHSRDELVDFFTRWKGRIMFGSDIVAVDDHLGLEQGVSEIGARASGREEAFDLYASRYWALRTLYETDYIGESPIADPDLHLVDPQKYNEMDAPYLYGKSLPREILKSLYYETAQALLEPLYAGTTV